MMSTKEIKKHAKQLGIVLQGDGRKNGVKNSWLEIINEALKLEELKKVELRTLNLPISRGHQYWDGTFEIIVHEGQVYRAPHSNVVECHTASRAGTFQASVFNWNWYAKANGKRQVNTVLDDFYHQPNLPILKLLLTRSLLRHLRAKLFFNTPNLVISRDEVELMIADGKVTGESLDQIQQACETLVKYNLATFENGFWILTELGLKQAQIFLN